jgi:hypothetical protein
VKNLYYKKERKTEKRKVREERKAEAVKKRKFMIREREENHWLWDERKAIVVS